MNNFGYIFSCSFYYFEKIGIDHNQQFVQKCQDPNRSIGVVDVDISSFRFTQVPLSTSIYKNAGEPGCANKAARTQAKRSYFQFYYIYACTLIRSDDVTSVNWAR